MPESYRLTFQMTRQMRSGRWFVVAFAACLLVAWAFGEKSSFKELADPGTPWPIRGSACAAVAAWLIITVMISFWIVKLARPPATENLVVEKDFIWWMPAFPFTQVRNGQTLSQYLRRRAKDTEGVRIPCASVTSIGFELLDVEDGRKTFVLRYDQNTCVLGVMLSDNELHWLNARLTEWKNSAG